MLIASLGDELAGLVGRDFRRDDIIQQNMYDERIIAAVKHELSKHSDLEVIEKRMFGSLCFMVNGKMFACVGKDELMCRVRLEDYETAIVKPGCRPMLRKGKVMKGPIFVSSTVLKSKTDFDYWFKLCHKFNRHL